MSNDRESPAATVARLRQAAGELIALIDTTPDPAHKRLLAAQAFELLRQSAQLMQQVEDTRSDGAAPPIMHPKKADT
jgi:hypothetical protein